MDLEIPVLAGSASVYVLTTNTKSLVERSANLPTNVRSSGEITIKSDGVLELTSVAGAVGAAGRPRLESETSRSFTTTISQPASVTMPLSMVANQGQNAIVPPQLQPANVSLPPGSRRNLVELEVTPTAGASGELLVYASSHSNYTFIGEFDGVPFGNFPFAYQPYEGLLGSYFIFDAIPEPSSSLLILAGLVLVSTRRRRQTSDRRARLACSAGI